LKAEDGVNDLLERIKNDPVFAAVADDLDSLLDPSKFIGRAPNQVREFMYEVVDPVLASRADVGVPDGEISV
jgi:adenylosuccinate lyase